MFWGTTIAVAVVVLAAVALLVVRRSTAERPSSPVNDARAQEVAGERRDLEEGKKLYAAGRFQESLELFRGVLAKDPNSAPAKQGAQLAETALAGKQEEARKSAEAEKAMETGRAALADGNFEEAKKQADQALALDPAREEARKLGEDASNKIAEAEAAKKKQARSAIASARRPTPAAKGKAAEAVPTAVPATAQASSTIPTLRLLFDSPVSEGHLMVAVNDQILLRKPFSFTRKQGLFKTIKETGTVDVSIPVQPGALNVKVWLSGPDIPASTLATTSAQMPAGGAKVLRVEYASGHLAAHIQ